MDHSPQGESEDARARRLRAEHLKETFFHITDAGGAGDTIALGPSPNSDGTVSVFLVSSTGERSPCDVVLAPGDLDNLARAARTSLSIDDLEASVEAARRRLRAGEFPALP